MRRRAMEEGDIQRQHLPLGLCYLFIGIVGCFGQLRLMSVFRYHSGRHGNSSNTYLLHLSLAVANFGVIGGFPFTALSYMAGRWLFGNTGCQLYACSGMTFGIASIFNFMLIAVERYTAIYKADLFKAALRHHYVMGIAVGWVMAIYWASLPLFGYGRYTLEPTGASCAINWQETDTGYPLFMLLLCSWCFGLPFLVIGVTLGLVSCVDPGKTVEDYRTDVLLTSEELVKLPRTLSLMSLFAWTPYACLCLQFLIRDPSETSMLTASMAPLFAKMVTSLMPFAYGFQSDGMLNYLLQIKSPEKRQ